MASERVFAAQDQVWDSYFWIEDEDDRRQVFDALFGLLEDPTPQGSEPATLDYHGTQADGFWLTLLDGRLVVPYMVTVLPSGREVIRLFRPIYLPPGSGQEGNRA